MKSQRYEAKVILDRIFVYGARDALYRSGSPHYFCKAFQEVARQTDAFSVCALPPRRIREMPVSALRWMVNHRRIEGFNLSDQYHDQCFRSFGADRFNKSAIISFVQNIGAGMRRRAIQPCGPSLFFFLDATLTQWLTESGDTGSYSHSLVEALVNQEAASFEVATAFFVYHKGVARSLVHDYSVPQRKILVVGRGANIDAAELRACRGAQSHAMPEAKVRKLTLMTVGRSPRRKGIHRVIEAIDSLAPSDQARIHYVVAGPLEEELPKRTYLEAMGFIGPQDRTRLLKRMAQADLGVLLTEWEGLPGSVWEFLRLGVPCWVSGLPQIKETLDTTSVVFEDLPMQPEAIRTTLRQLIAEPEVLDGMSAEAKRNSESYSWEHVARTCMGYLRIEEAVPCRCADK